MYQSHSVTEKALWLYLISGYVKKTTKVDEPTRTVPIILGAGFLLVLVIVIVVLARVCIVRKAKKPMNVSCEYIILLHRY